MKVIQRRYAGPKSAEAPQQGFVLNIRVASSTGLPSTIEIKEALLDVGFPPSVASNSSVHSPSAWK